jgi:UDP-glucuronate decarboxylase
MNIGTEFELTIKDLAELILELTESKSRIVYLPLPQDDPKQRKPDLQLARELINWRPDVSIKDGIQLTIKYFQNHIKK